MAKAGRSKSAKESDDYRHQDAHRLNNPEVGLALYDTEPSPSRPYRYDPHLDPDFVWEGRHERTDFRVDAVSIHVHEILSAARIVRTLRKQLPQLALFDDPQLNRNRAVEFYQHEVDWKNRLILGDSLVIMTSLLERERLGGRVQCIYFDPPYGINYNSNFQARISNRSPKESDNWLTREPEQVQAYRDTWQLGVHSYLTYLRERFLAARELLADDGSMFVQIGEDNVHRVRLLLDAIFGAQNWLATIAVQKTSGFGSRLLDRVTDNLLWYAKFRDRVKYRQLYVARDARSADPELEKYDRVELPDGSRRSMTVEERANPMLLPKGSRRYMSDNLTSQEFRKDTTVPYTFDGRTYFPGRNSHWKTTVAGLNRLAEKRRLEPTSISLRYVRFADDLPGRRINNLWADTSAGAVKGKRYVVQTNPKIVARCLLMATDPGDLVLDPTCGSGTTAYVAEQYGRRWIACDTSGVALSLARERILTATYPYYHLAAEEHGVSAGFRLKSSLRRTITTLAYDRPPEEIPLYDQPEIDSSKVRVSGPFTVEGLSRYAINPMQENVPQDPRELGATADHLNDLLDALRVRGIPVRNGPDIRITHLTRLTDTMPLHAEGTTEDGKRFVVSIGPRYGPITSRQVHDVLDNGALNDASVYDLVVFAGFSATAEAQRYLGNGVSSRYNVVLLEANADLLVADLLKNTRASQTFRLFAAPDVTVHRHPDGSVHVTLRAVDVYDARKGETAEKSRDEIAAWFIDHDYDYRVFHVKQAFFPKSEGWVALGRDLKGILDQEALAKLATFESNPFKPGKHRRAAVRVVDDSGQMSEVVVNLTT